MKKIFLILLCLITAFSLFSCGKNYDVKKIDGYVVEKSDTPTNYVRIVMKDGSAMLIELYPEYAPITVQNFKNLVSEKYYDGVTFHRVIEGFMIQGGDPDGDGRSNGDKPTIKGEFTANGVDNPLSKQHTRGVISMARANIPNSASTQFFIVHETPSVPYPYNSLDGNYAAFGRVIAGYSTLDKIAGVPTNSNDKPIKAQTMAEVRFVNIVSGGN